MAAVGAEVAGSSFLLSSGVVSFFIILLLLSIFLTALCSDCGRQSFELRDQEVENPFTLIRVVKLEEAMVARENPMINEIQNDERDFRGIEEATVSFRTSKSQMGAPQNHHDIQTNGSTTMMAESGPESAADSSPEDEVSVTFTPWRTHLRAPQSQDMSSSAPPDVFNTVGGRRSSDDTATPSANHRPGPGIHDADLEDFNQCDVDVKSVYARVSKQGRLATPTKPVEVQEEQEEEEEEQEEESPPLPDRNMMVEA